MNSDGTHLGGFLEEARLGWGLKEMWFSSGNSGDSKAFRFRCEDEQKGSMGDGGSDMVPCGQSNVSTMDIRETGLGRNRLEDSEGQEVPTSTFTPSN